jgi:putative ABC transport system permease protein
VAGEVALALVVAVASGLMLRSLQALYAVDPGLRAERVLLFKVSPPGAKYGDAAAFNALYDRVQERLERLPGVRSAGAIQLLPLTWGNWGFPSHVEGHPVAPGASPPSLNFRVIRPGWFETAGIPLRGGRHLRPTDGLGEAPDLAVVNEALARRFWPQDPLAGPLGREIRIFSPQGPPVRIVGVVGDVRQHALDQEVEPELYVTAQEWTWPVSLWMALRVDGDPLALGSAVREAVWEVDRDVPVGEMRTMADVVARSAGTRRLLAFLLGGLGALALGLGSVGVFVVTAYTMARRTPELGLRKALGATGRGLVGEGLRRGMRPVAAGVLAGTALALLGGRLLAAHLYGVTPRDPLTLGATALLLLAVGATATALPTWRASAVDPMRALRED